MGGDVIHGEDYTGNGRLANFRYGSYVSDAVRRSGADFKNFGNFGTAWGMWAE